MIDHLNKNHKATLSASTNNTLSTTNLRKQLLERLSTDSESLSRGSRPQEQLRSLGSPSKRINVLLDSENLGRKERILKDELSDFDGAGESIALETGREGGWGAEACFDEVAVEGNVAGEEDRVGDGGDVSKGFFERGGVGGGDGELDVAGGERGGDEGGGDGAGGGEGGGGDGLGNAEDEGEDWEELELHSDGCLGVVGVWFGLRLAVVVEMRRLLRMVRMLRRLREGLYIQSFQSCQWSEERLSSHDLSSPSRQLPTQHCMIPTILRLGSEMASNSIVSIKLLNSSFHCAIPPVSEVRSLRRHCRSLRRAQMNQRQV